MEKTTTATKEDRVKIQIPFSGFYNSIHGGEGSNIDRALEDGFNYNYETQEEQEVPDIWGADIDYKAIELEYCKNFVEAFGDKYELDVTFDEMTSPKEYNFSTDRIFALIPREQIDKLRKEVEAHKDYPQLIKDRFTSYDGFWSFYSNDYKDEDWTKEILDECQYEVLIEFWLNNISDDVSDEGWNMEEWYLTNDFEMCNWDSVIAAHEKIRQYLREEEIKEAVKKIENALDWIREEYGAEFNMPSFAYESTRDMQDAIKILEAKNVSKV